VGLKKSELIKPLTTYQLSTLTAIILPLVKIIPIRLKGFGAN